MTTAINEVIDNMIEHQNKVIKGECKNNPELVIITLTIIKSLLNGK
jgi:hypothetical protein